MAVQIGPKIGIEGEKEYRSQINQIIEQTKTLDSAMQATASSFDKNTSSMTKNKATAQTLAQKISLAETKLAAMNTMLEQSAQKFGENDTKTLKWKQAVDSTTASLNQMKQELQGLNGAADLSDFSTKMADMGTKMQNIGQSLTSVGQKMTMSITLPIVAAGTAAVKLASDTEEARSKVEVVFGSMSESVKNFASDALNSYGLAEGSALQMVSTFGAMATSMGLSEQQAANMSTELTALAADMASFYNVSTDVAQTSLQGVFTGETEALKKFGIVMTQTNLEEFASKQGKVYNQMSESEKVMTRYAYVMDATKDAQGDFARTSDGTANSLRVFSESCKELGAAFGEALLPVITPIIQALTSLVQKIASLPAPVQKFIAVLALVAAAIGPLILTVGMFCSAIGSIINIVPSAVSAITALNAALAASGLTITGVLLPALAVVAAVLAGLAIGYEVAKHWDDITAAASNFASGVKSAFDKVMAKNEELKNSVNNFISEVGQAFAKLPGKIIEAIKKAVEKTKEEFANMIKNAKQSGKDFVEGFVDGIREKIQKIIDAVKDIAQTVEEYLGFSCPDKGPLSKYETWMPDFMQGLAKGIRSNMGVVKGAMKDVSKTMALPLSTSATMNMALAGAADGSASAFGSSTMNIYVDHISELNDLIRIQNQAQQRMRMGAR